MIRPELQQGLIRHRELIAALAVAALGLWTAWQGGYLLVPLGLIVAGLGIGWAILSARRLRFQQEGDAPGILRVTEAQIAYMGPRTGGFIGLPDLTEIRLLTLRGRRIWRLKQADGQLLHIPVEAAGAEALFDAFASLPGMDTATLVAALGTQAPTGGTVIALDGADRLIWSRKGQGMVVR